ncbi:MAG: hypothetical protein WKG07_30185 [Hymenobacter sp.]
MMPTSRPFPRPTAGTPRPPTTRASPATSCWPSWTATSSPLCAAST